MEFLRPNLNFDFIGKKWPFIGLSLAVIAFSFVVFATMGLKLGIDFAGGTEVYIKFKDPISSADVRKLLSDHDLKDASVQNFGKEGSYEYLIRLEKSSDSLSSVSKDIENLFTQIKGKDSFVIEKVEMVGPKVGNDLKKRAAWAMFYALLGILVYVAVRFDYRFSPGGVVALIHDVIVTMGIFAFLGKKFDLTILAAVLTIVGYSINDTIVIFDRIRENIKKFQGMDIVEVTNKSINETLSRTILTSLTVFLVVLALFFLGGEVIHDFAFVMIVGVVSGTYSTLFIASPIFLYLYRYAEKKSQHA